MEQGHIDLRDVEVFVLDEADRMLDMGFLPALKKIIAKLPAERQSLFFSATMPPKIRDLSAQLLSNPLSVNVTPKSSSVERIEQTVRMVERANKLDSLRELLAGESVDRTIVFTRTKHGANALVRKLVRAGICATAIHGNKSQSARQNALEAFRSKQVTVLVATDVAARGIDIDNVTHVINFDMPVEPESYVHRIGRTGRAGADGVAISFCTMDEHDKLRAIEKLIGLRLQVDNRAAGPNTSPPAAPDSARKSKRGHRARRPLPKNKKARRASPGIQRRTASVV
jgi:ATP-dependent RNA helicase RhlE